MTDKLHWITFNGFEFQLLYSEIDAVPRSGAADEAVEWLASNPATRERLAHIAPDALAEELKGYGAWDAAELADHEANVRRVLWLGAVNAREETTEEA